ncbi:MAG: hypothetical protein ACX930_02430 [Erythrobacter sp.]
MAGFLAACGANTSPEPQGKSVECAIGPGAELRRVCTLEELPQAQFVIHHPDGGFRRFVNEDEGMNVADGADPIGMSVVEDDESPMLELSVGNDRYRIPQDLVPQTADD